MRKITGSLGFERPAPWGKRLCGLAAGLLILALALPAAAQSVRYERNLLRLSEILGAMHHLQQICGRYDDQNWRNRMLEVMKAERAEGDKKQRLTDTFNRGYTKHQELFTSCTHAADQYIDTFVSEGTELTEWLSNNRQ